MRRSERGTARRWRTLWLVPSGVLTLWQLRNAQYWDALTSGMTTVTVGLALRSSRTRAQRYALCAAALVLTAMFLLRMVVG